MARFFAGFTVAVAKHNLDADASAELYRRV